MKSTSKSLVAAAALTLGLFAQQQSPFLPPVPVPPENPITPAKTVLGKILFWDEQLSSDNTVACGTCHIPAAGGGDPRSFSQLNLHPGSDGTFGTGDDVRGSRGVVHCDTNKSFTPDAHFFPNPQVTGRKSPSFIGVQWHPQLFWDGRAGGTFIDPERQTVVIPQGAAMETQAAGPITSSVEMACSTRSHGEVNQKLEVSKPLNLARNIPADMAAAIAANPTYPALFTAAFGTPEITAARIAMAIATYERTLVPDQSPFDNYVRGNQVAMTPQQIAGMNLFTGPANCAHCHTMPFFSNAFVPPGTVFDPADAEGFENIGVRPPGEDPGRGGASGLADELNAFKTPTLRNVALRAPFFHNGGKATLMEAVEFYMAGGDFPNQPNIDAHMTPFSLTETEKQALLAFMEGLTDPRVANEQYPFDRPTLASEYLTNGNCFGTAKAGSGGIVPMHMTVSPPVLGNEDYRLGMSGGIGGGFAYLILSGSRATAGTWIDSVPMNVNLADSFLQVLPMPLGGAPGIAGAGFGSIGIPMPRFPFLAGATARSQWIVVDPGAIGGISSTDGLEVTMIMN